MIWYKHHMGSQTCVGGILNQTSNQLMHLLGEKVTLGSFIPATTDFTATLYNTQGTPGAFSCSRDFLPAFSISIDPMRSTPSPEGFADPVSPSDGARSRSSTTTEDHKSGHKRSIADAQRDENNQFKYQNARSSVVVQAGTQKTNEDVRRQSPFQMQNTAASRHESGGPTSSKSTLSLVLTNPEITEIDISERDSSEEVTESPPLDCTPAGFHNMNEGEDKHLWDKEKPNDETTESGSTLPGDETGGNGSSGGSLQASDNSEDSHGQQGTHMLPTTETNSGKGTTGESSTFLFIGPVGKKRRYCRDRQKSGDMEQDSPSSLAPPTPTGGGGDSLPDHFLGDPSPEHEESGETSGGSGSTSSVIRTVKAEQQQQQSMNTGGVITSTPTPVIRSVPSSRRREDQPLNLSLPSPSEAPSSILPSPRRSESSVHVSVISMARRERDDMEWDFPQEVSSPGQSIYSGRSPRESSGGEQTQSTSRLSPLPSTQRDIHSISSSSASAFGVAGQVPNTFQGLLAAHGIVSPVTSRGGGGMSLTGNNVNAGPSGTQKRRLQCKDCGKEFSQLRNYRYHRSRHEGTQQFACTCPVCGKTFNDKGYLSSHLKIHRNAKEYKCEWCEKSFNQRVAYNMHVRIHTGHKPHKCPICPKAFSRKMLLRQHLRTHTGERPYKCEICGKAFADRSNMLLHQRLHSGQRPYKCDICGKSFSKNHHLKTHLNHHAGIKPYQCEKCKACFSQSSNMKTHFKKCTGVSNASCTVTSGSFQQSSTGMMIQSAGSTGIGSGGNLSLPSHSLPSPNTIPRYRMTEEAREELQLHQQQQQIQQQHRILSQQEQFQQLNPAQQQLLLRELTQSAAGGSSGLLGMPSHPPHSSQSGPGSQSFANQISQVQSLGLNMGMLGLASPGPGRPRRGTTSSSGMTLIPMGSPSPTSLAAGHPLIPLASVENSGGISAGVHTSSQGSIQTNPMLMLSPRQHHTNIDLNAATLSQLQALTQQATSTQRRMLSSRLRMSQQQELNLLSLHQQQPQLGDGGISQLLSPPQRPSPQRGSPQRLISPRQTQSGSSMSNSDHYELVLPAFAVSRNLGSVHQSQVPFEQFAQPTRSHSHQHQIRGSGPGVNGNQHSHIQNSLLTVARTSASSTVTSLQSDEGYFNAQDQSDFMDPNDATRETNWRNRDAEISRYDDYKPI